MYTLSFKHFRGVTVFHDVPLDWAWKNALSNDISKAAKPLSEETRIAIDKFSTLVAEKFNTDKNAQDVFLNTINWMTHKSLSHPEAFSLFVNKAFERYKEKLEWLTGKARLQTIEWFTDFLHKIMSQFAPLERIWAFWDIIKIKKEELDSKSGEVIKNTMFALSELKKDITPHQA